MQLLMAFRDAVVNLQMPLPIKPLFSAGCISGPRPTAGRFFCRRYAALVGLSRLKVTSLRTGNLGSVSELGTDRIANETNLEK
jgi:hypothetical protein